ncbi:MAG: hypothetical protein ACNA7J_07140, partial [Wenzhouxiangella sp.]
MPALNRAGFFLPSPVSPLPLSPAFRLNPLAHVLGASVLVVVEHGADEIGPPVLVELADRL